MRLGPCPSCWNGGLQLLVLVQDLWPAERKVGRMRSPGSDRSSREARG